ncbi:M14 family zinc carboxypeptidase [Ulvibacter litoralis]|uniref:Zinc carboxypeptidase n=1 Tax=Ulvibacter litoralis TaxID=227084 RepID=A0A1G7FB80_9FLAO|nr:M14 family zinc carboxypeptidase [Ulvibacter litoralis]GHC51909.1 peptidase M14 [Ulvibacter litoralis]SDE73143.1 Zinc carboxypeptidase [Ulvibacter litoralis]
MNITTWYASNYESQLRDRYIDLAHISPLLSSYKNQFKIASIGVSENGKDIPMVTIGSGKKKVLGWSQMHGNEATTTKAIFDFLKFIAQKEFFQKEINEFLAHYTFYIIPILNPDGASLYTRVNANKVDLNRDAQETTQNESRVLQSVFNELQPDLCLNLHDQRTIYGLATGLPATVSFLAPSADKERSITPARIVAMEHIVRMNRALQQYIPGQVGRYDDGFNANCVGDTFQMAGVPTILFEAGHYALDYSRETTRSFIFYAFLELFDITNQSETPVTYEDYFKIPQNNLTYNDVVLRNVRVDAYKQPIAVAIQYVEELEGDVISFKPIVSKIGGCDEIKGHKEIDLKGNGILINSQENIFEDLIISTIVSKMDNSVINILVK